MTLKEIRKQIDDLEKLRMEITRRLWTEAHPEGTGKISVGEFVAFRDEQERLGK